MRALFVVIFLLLAAGLRASTPDVDEIIRQLAAAASDPALQQARDAVAYDRESRVDYLDDDVVKKRVVRHYRVEPENGQPVTRLISVNGKPAEERPDRRKSAARETGEKGRTLELSSDLLSRYEFSFLRAEILEGRKAWMLRFTPKPNVEAEEFFDRLINSLSGFLWIDAEESQLAKAEIFLAKKVSFFGGIAGAIDRMNLTIVQRRVEPNIWLGESTFLDFSGRKLFSAIRFRAYEKCTGFRQWLATSASN